MKMKSKITKSVFLLLVLLGLGFAGTAFAADVSVSLRYQSNLLFQGQIALPAPGTVTLNDMAGVPRTVNAQSVLALLANIDASNPAFAVSKLQYFPGFSPPSLYLKCIQIPAEAVEACDNWLYVVQGTSPALGMDQYILQGGEQVFIYFGPSRRVYMENSQVGNNGTFIASAQTYNYQDNTWSPATLVTIGVFTGDYWAPTVLATQAVNQTGQAVFQLSTPGTYGVGIQEDFYYPFISFTVVQSGLPGGSAGSQNPVAQDSAPKIFSAEKAAGFLAIRQNADGSFGSSPMFSDWAAVALGSLEEESAAKTRLSEYLLEDSNPGEFVSDSLRRAMALMALGINPYSGTKTNYIENITKSFDGTQFGDSGLYNDDVFSLLVLLKAGYSPPDEIIEKTISFILSFQQQNGSWNGVDMTAAAVQALSLVSSQENVKEALLKAMAYLQKSQENNGSFGNMYSTSWAMQAIAALNETTSSQYLASQQAQDGGVESLGTWDNRIWATSYAIPAALGKDWGKVLVAFEKPGLDLMLTQEIQAKLDAIAQETQVLTLAVVELELQNITAEVAALEPRVLVFLRDISRRETFVESQEEQFVATAKPIVGSELSASVGEATRTQLPWQDLVPYIVAGGVLAFLLFGNPNAVLSFLRGRLSKVG